MLDSENVAGWFLQVGTANFGFCARRHQAEQVLKQKGGVVTPMSKDWKLLPSITNEELDAAMQAQTKEGGK